MKCFKCGLDTKDSDADFVVALENKVFYPVCSNHLRTLLSKGLPQSDWKPLPRRSNGRGNSNPNPPGQVK